MDYLYFTKQFVYLNLNLYNMKLFFTLALSAACVAGYAQPKLISQATISTKITIVAPEEEDGPPPNVQTSGNGEEVRIMRFGGEGETKSTTYLKNDLVKTFSETEMGRTTIIRDNSKKTTITLMEMMGKKFGIKSTDEEQEAMRKRMDSMMKTRNDNPLAGNSEPKTNIVYLDESKKIAGYDCKKALILSTRSNGKTDTSLVWYSPDFTLQGVSSTGGSGGFGPQTGSSGLELLKGFPLQYERNMGRGRKMTVLVTKIDFEKAVSDKEFEIPKDIEIRSMKDMQGGGVGMGMQIRVGG